MPSADKPNSSSYQIKGMNKLSFSSFFFCLFSFFLFSELKANDSGPDSLRQVINLTKGEEKLRLLEQYVTNSPTDVELIGVLEKEALSQSSYLYLASAYKSKVYYYTRIGNRDSIRLYLNLTEQALNSFEVKEDNKISKDKKKKYDTIFKMLYTTRTALYLHEGKYSLALHEIDNVLNNSKVDKTADFENQLHTLSGLAYLHTKKYTEALSSFRKAYLLVNQTSNESNIGKYSYYMALEGTGCAYAGLGRYKDAILVTDTLINKIEEEKEIYNAVKGVNAEADFIYSYFKYKATAFAALWNIKTDRLNKARVQLNDVHSFIEKALNTHPPHTDFDIYYVIEAEYYLKTGQYAISQQRITALIDRISLQEQFPLYSLANQLLAKIQEAQGKSKEAYHLVVNLSRINDSINAASFSSQLAEMNILYEVDKSKMLAEQKKSELKLTQIILSAIAFAFLLSLIIIYLIYKNRVKLIEKNKQLYSQYQSIDAQNKKIRELQAIQENLMVKEELTTDLHQNLIEKLDKYLDESKIYLDPEVNREKVALEIGTNRQYLIEAIKEKSGKTFNEYIYSYRLKFAYDLIVNDKEKAISDILNEAGFPTRATFYKQFKDTYGLTPSELRSIINNN